MQLDAYEAQFAEAVERSFRDDAIRTAVLIDDQFPDYLNLRNAADTEFSEIKRALAIYAFMHNRGLICDVHNWRTPQDADLPLLEKARKSDLILLDYQLGAAGSKTALKILRHLAVSTHFNLVVLYTAEASPTVSLTVAAAMRGLKEPPEANVPTPDVLENAEDLLAEERFSTIDAQGVRAYLTEGKTPWQGDLATSLGEAGIPLQNLKPLADFIARRWIATLATDYQIQSNQELSVECAIYAERPMWIRCGSCFVAVVQKLPASSPLDEGEYVWAQLGAALRTWQPNIYRLILSEIQNALELEAVVDHEKWLSDELALGLGLYLLENDDAARGKVSGADVEGAAQNLIDRFIDIIRRRLATHKRISSTAIELLGARLATAIGDAPAGESARFIRSRELAHVPVTTPVDWKNKIVPAANAFMVSDAFRGGHITTGSVLRGPADDYWLCSSPACDLVPREDGPVLIQLMRLERTNAPPEKFTSGEFVVIGSADEVVMLRAIEAKIRQPSLVTVVLPSGTRVTRDQDEAFFLSGWIADDRGLRSASVAHGFPADEAVPNNLPFEESDTPPVGTVTEPGVVTVAVPAEDGQPQDAAAAENSLVLDEAGENTPVPTKFAVVAQLRTGFATRFLMIAGQHQSGRRRLHRLLGGRLVRSRALDREFIHLTASRCDSGMTTRSHMGPVWNRGVTLKRLTKPAERLFLRDRASASNGRNWAPGGLSRPASTPRPLRRNDWPVWHVVLRGCYPSATP